MERTWRPIFAKTGDFIREAAGRGAQVILPSELFQGLYFCTQQDPKWFETAYPAREHPCVLALSKLAQELSVVIPVSFFERDGHHYYNSWRWLAPMAKSSASIARAIFPMGQAIRKNIIFAPAIRVQGVEDEAWRDRRWHLLGSVVPGMARAMALRGRRFCFIPQPSAGSLTTPRSIPPQWRRAMQGHAVAMPAGRSRQPHRPGGERRGDATLLR